MRIFLAALVLLASCIEGGAEESAEQQNRAHMFEARYTEFIGAWAQARVELDEGAFRLGLEDVCLEFVDVSAAIALLTEQIPRRRTGDAPSREEADEALQLALKLADAARMPDSADQEARDRLHRLQVLALSGAAEILIERHEYGHALEAHERLLHFGLSESRVGFHWCNHTVLGGFTGAIMDLLHLQSPLEALQLGFRIRNEVQGCCPACRDEIERVFLIAATYGVKELFEEPEFPDLKVLVHDSDSAPSLLLTLAKKLLTEGKPELAGKAAGLITSSWPACAEATGAGELLRSLKTPQSR